MLDSDIITAQKIVAKPYINCTDKVFHTNSFIYRGSNEKTNFLNKYFKDRLDLLTVISSSDQLLNAIYMGVKNIDAFDISNFPKYYMYLKLAALKTLDRNDYLDFFYNATGNAEKYDDMYFDGIRKYLTPDIESFWTSLINFYDWPDITFSSLFSGEVVSESAAPLKNIYLEKDKYNKMKDLIENVSINTYEGDILSLANVLNNKYDLVYLSNIMNYVDKKKYKEMLNKINLKKDGKILTYVYDYNNRIYNFFNEPEYSFDSFEKDKLSGVLVYKR